MEKFFYPILIVHIGAGSLALLAGLFAILLRKNVKRHRPVGKIYFWSMTVVFFSAIYMSIAHDNIFLFCVSIFTYYSCLTAYRSLYLKKLHLDQKPMWYDWAIEAVFGTINVGFVVFAFFLMKQNLSFGIISLVFGTLGVRGNLRTIGRFQKKLEYRNYWLLAHIGGMCGSYIGAITAFVVNNSRIFPFPPVVLWLGPAAFIVPFIIYEVNQHQKKAGKFVEAKVG
jgi:hypothetical protein